MDHFLAGVEGQRLRRVLFNHMDMAAAPADFEEEGVWPAIEQYMNNSRGAGVWFRIEWRTWEGRF
jgi:hypothetical protein